MPSCADGSANLRKVHLANCQRDLPDDTAQCLSVATPHGCTGLMPEAFARCGTLVTMVIHSGVTKIPEGAFRDCVNLGHVTLPPGLVSIGAHAFHGCVRLADCALPASLVSIATEAFRQCESLPTAFVPDNVALLGNGVFFECKTLIEAVLPRRLNTRFNHCFAGCSSLRTVQIPEGCSSIGFGSFQGCVSLTHVNIPSTVTWIGLQAFSGCRALTSVALPPSVTHIDAGAFQDCTSLVVVTVPNREAEFRDLFAAFPAIVRRSASRTDNWVATFKGCTALQCVQAPALLSKFSREMFEDTPLEKNDTLLLGDTTAHQRKALLLRFWSRQTHRLCSPNRRRWVEVLMLIARRLSSQGFHLPEELWIGILSAIPRCELGHLV